MKKRQWWVAAWITGLVFLGCSPNHIVGGVMDEATDQIGQEIAERVVNAYLGEVGPAIIRSYTIGLMQVMFYQGGYYTADLEFEPGEYTIWTSEDSPYGEVIERAFLQRRDDGWEWWRIEIFGEDPDSDDDMHMIMEALFEPVDDKRYIREMYVQYPDSDEPEEVEISEDDTEEWVIRAEEWSDEEMSEALVGTEEVTVPAGTFTADHYRGEAIEHEDIVTEWWITERDVPGSIVKVHQHEDGGDEVQTMVLDSFGTGADSSVLGAF